MRGPPRPPPLWMRGHPRLCGPAQAALLLLGDHLQRVAPPRSALRLHLDEREPPPPADDQVQLVAARPDVALEDPVAAKAVEPPRAPFGRPAGRRSATRSKGR